MTDEQRKQIESASQIYLKDNNYVSMSYHISRAYEYGAGFGLSLATDRDKELEQIREAFANYMGSEGCSCCRDTEAHERHEKRLAELLGVEMYEDKSGYNFGKYVNNY